jgi:hypothetical protein
MCKVNSAAYDRRIMPQPEISVGGASLERLPWLAASKQLWRGFGFAVLLEEVHV